MGIIRKLASQTAIYGISSMLGRFINFLLVIPHTSLLKSVGDYGDITTVFAFIAFLNVILTYGMSTTYFNFIRRGYNPEQVFAVSQKSLLISTLVFSVFVLLFANSCAVFMGFPGHSDFVYCCLIFLVFDTLSTLPFARLRFEERPLKFALIKLVNILVNVGLNLYLLIYTPAFLDSCNQVTLILIANAVASMVSFLLLFPLVVRIGHMFDFQLFRHMLKYTWPLVFVGLAGIVNETLDRTLLKWMLPAEEGSYQNGIYGAFYKLTMVMTMFVQAFNFAAEPLFFKQQENDGSRKVYSDIMYWFTGVCAFIFLSCMLFIDELSHLFIRKAAFFNDPNGLYVVPILLLANLFLGIYYNLSVWYKLTGKTSLGAIISVGGALITIVLNIIFIPRYGFVSCAWITLIVYASMCIASYAFGHVHYKIPYELIKYIGLISVAVGLWILYVQLKDQAGSILLGYLLKLLFPALLLLIIWLLQPKRKIA